MSFSIKFNDINLSGLVSGITSIKRDMGSSYTNNLQSGGSAQLGRYGQDFLYNSIGPKQISITFTASGNANTWSILRTKMAALLNVSEPKPLIFDDEPNKVWYALPDGTPSLDENIITNTATGTLNFLVPSGIAESIDSKVLNETNSGSENGDIIHNEDGSITIKVKNNGTIETYPKIKVTHNSNNGYVGIVSAQSIVQLGSIDETLISNETKEKIKYKSGWLLNGKRSQSANFEKFANSNDVNKQNPNLKTAGSLAFQNDGLRLTSMGAAPGTGTWLTQGGLKKFTIPADENNKVGAQRFSSYMNILAWAGKMGQTGLLQVLYVSSDNQLICGFGVYKDDSKGNTARAQYYIGGNHARTFHSFQFQANNAESNQKYKNKNFNTSKGGVTITKSSGGKFKWSLTDTSQTLTVPELDSKKVAYVYVYIGQLKGRNTSVNQFMTNLVLRELSFRKDDVEMYFDESTDVSTLIPADPNHYGVGEVVVADMKTAKIYKKDGTLPGNDELITGSEFFSIPPGESEIDLSFSDTMEVAPDIEISWKERYI